MKVNEIFKSMQGEGSTAGKETIFLRLAGCNLHCIWCDSIAEKTLIRTSDKEWKRIEDIEIGQKIIGVTKEKNHILQNRYNYIEAKAMSKSCHFEDNSLEITFSNEQKVISTKNHLFFVRRKDGKYNNIQWKWIEARELKKDDIVWSIGEPYKNKETNDFILGWLAGFTIGDGSKNKKYGYYVWDTITIEIYERLKKYLEKIEVRFSVIKKRKGKETKQGLQNTIFRLYSGQYKINRKNTKEWKRGLISGFFDAEGFNNDVQIIFSNKEKEILFEIKEYLKEFGFDSYLKEKKSCFNLIVSLTFSRRLYFDSFFDYCKPHFRKWFWNEKGIRKGGIQRSFRQAKNLVSIVDIKNINKQVKFYDINSSSDNFFANGILVHNTPYTWNWEGTSFEHSEKYDMEIEMIDKTVTKVLDDILRFDKGGCKSLVITGGEPLLQMQSIERIVEYLKQMRWWIEIETNGTIQPSIKVEELTDQFNVSPKLSNSGNPKEKRERSYVLEEFVSMRKSIFKFVVHIKNDVKEVDSLVNRYGISFDKIFLMPLGATRKELNRNKPFVKEVAEKKGYQFSDRLQVEYFDDKRGV